MLDFALALMMSLLEVFYRPGRLFAALPAKRGAWIAPFVCNVLLLLLTGVLVPHYIGRENLVRSQVQRDPRLTSEQKERAIAGADSFGRVIGGYVATVVLAVLLQLAIAGILTIFGMMTHRPPSFATMLSVVAFSLVPCCVTFAALTAETLLTAPNPALLDPSKLVGTNLAFYVRPGTVSNGVYSVLHSLDLLSLAAIGLLSLGFSKVTGSGVLLGLAVVGGVWIFYTSVMTIFVLL